MINFKCGKRSNENVNKNTVTTHEEKITGYV
jgi:hypothetical protein